LHSANCCVQLLWHAAAAVPRVAASDRPTSATRNTARRRDRNHSVLPPSAGRQRGSDRDGPAVTSKPPACVRCRTIPTAVPGSCWVYLPVWPRVGRRRESAPPNAAALSPRSLAWIALRRGGRRSPTRTWVRIEKACTDVRPWFHARARWEADRPPARRFPEQVICSACGERPRARRPTPALSFRKGRGLVDAPGRALLGA